ncbi:MAG: DUF1573 domain-containing protein [Proteobacteria bacterium]|nr:DUF1573 domain-containing protein [Pseudomonadota bacterium]
MSARKNKKRLFGSQSATAAPRWGRRRVLIATAGILVLGAGGAYLYGADDQAAEATLVYSPDEIVESTPIHAVHEMGPGSRSRVRLVAADQPQPKIELPLAYYDFGRIGAKAVVERKFLIRNTGAGPLTIGRAYTSCDCTTAHVTARVIPPGKAALATLTLDAGFHDVRGETVRRGLIIESNDRTQPEAAIWIQARVGWS